MPIVMNAGMQNMFIFTGRYTENLKQTYCFLNSRQPSPYSNTHIYKELIKAQIVL